MPWLVATIVLGTLFVAGQLVAWNQLALEHIHFATSGQSAKSFFLITGVHGAHLLVGLAALIAALLGLRLARQVETRQILVDLAAWYWHSMGLLWIALFALLAWCQ